jgi:3-carboxy-cis,cis-muconate cycloisomerase
MSGGASREVFDQLFATPEAAAIFGDAGRLQGMLDFEAALARAEARVGVIPAGAVAPIAAKCRAELIDLPALAEATASAGTPAIPLVKQLTALVARDDAQAARYVHWGATSQDAMDTGLVLQLRRLLALLDEDLQRLERALVQLARAHRTTPLAGRTWLQQGPPVTFGLKAAGWLDAVGRHAVRLEQVRERALVLQFGGAVGTLAALGDRGLAVAEALAGELALPLPDMPWHGTRDRVAGVAVVLGLLIGTLGKMGRDLSLMMQTEVAEAFEPAGEGRGGSSTMAHKRNPVSAAVQLAAATRAPGLVATMLSAMTAEHERGLGGWHAEWTALPELCLLAAGALRQTADTMEGLELDPARMRANLETTHGLIFAEAVTMALAEKLGKAQAHELVEHASRRAAKEQRHLRDLLGADATVTAHLSPAELDRLFEPDGYLGVAQAFIDRVVQTQRTRRKER